MSVFAARPARGFAVALTLAALPAALAAALFPSPASAEPITFSFRGTVTSVTSEPNFRGNPPVDWPGPGTPFVGTYTFESTRPDTAMNEWQGVYTTSPGGDVHVAVGDFRWYAPASGVGVIESSGAATEDIYEAGDWIPSMQLVSHPELAPFYDIWNFQLTLRGGDDLLDGTDLPLTPPDLSRATTRTLTLYGDNSLNTTPIPLVVITASLDSLTVVPEPSGLAAASTAAGALLLSRRRRPRH